MEGMLDGKTCANIGDIEVMLEWSGRERGAGKAWVCRGVVLLIWDVSIWAGLDTQDLILG